MSARWVIVIFGILTLGVLADILAVNAGFTYAYLTGRCSKAPLPVVCTESNYFGLRKPAPSPATQP